MLFPSEERSLCRCVHDREDPSPVHESEEEHSSDQHSSSHAQAYLCLHGECRWHGLGLILDGAQGQAQVAHLHLVGGKAPERGLSVLHLAIYLCTQGPALPQTVAVCWSHWQAVEPVGVAHSTDG